MRIGINTRVLLKHRMEGVARYTYEISKRLVLDHPEDEFYFFFDRDYDDSFVFAENVIPIILGPQARHPALWYSWFELSIPKALEQYAIDVFFSPDTYLSLRTDMPTLLTCHDLAYLHYPKHIPFLIRKYYQYYFPRFHRRADHIIAVSHSTKDDIIKQYNIPPSKITVGYNGVGNNFTPLDPVKQVDIRLSLTSGDPYFIYVGSIHPRKNIVRLVKAFDQFCDSTESTHKLIILGRWAWNNDKIAGTIANAKHLQRIKLIDDMKGDISDILASATALVYVSLFEGFGLPLLEAMQCEVPVITSDRGALKEIAGGAALLVDPENVDAIAYAMTRIVSEENLDLELIDKGRTRVADFNWKDSADVVYERLRLLSVTP